MFKQVLKKPRTIVVSLGKNDSPAWYFWLGVALDVVDLIPTVYAIVIDIMFLGKTKCFCL